MLELEQVRRYAWADEDANLAWTVAVIVGSTTDEVVTAYGGSSEEPRLMTFREAGVDGSTREGESNLLVLRNECHVAIENNGWAGKNVETAKRASRSGQFFSVYWSLNANYMVTQAVDGKLVAHFDPLTVQHPAPIGETYPDWITDVVFTDDNLHAILLATVEEHTGVAFEAAWLADPLPTYLIPA
ncbi:MAG: DUF6461 domain-containing protein [Actinomycetota bacterium]|nr:DUF6461 domain-containing protein [Actinomycetota bacterium]